MLACLKVVWNENWKKNSKTLTDKEAKSSLQQKELKHATFFSYETSEKRTKNPAFLLHKTGSFQSVCFESPWVFFRFTISLRMLPYASHYKMIKK